MINRYARPRMKAVWSDKGKYDGWLQVELAVSEAWAAEGVIPPQEIEKLRQAHYDPNIIKRIFQQTRHDMTAFLQSITAHLGPEGRWLHLGLTSNDIIDTAQCMQLRDAADILLEDIDALMMEVECRALEHKNTIMMGRTHGVHAEPITFGLKLAMWWDELRRNRHRLKEARQEISVGKISGAVGTHATIPSSIEERVCAQLGLNVAPVSNQIVQRDRHAHFVVTLALVAASLEKFATEVRHLQRTEVREVQEAFAHGQTGSSAMPHKRNPELSERVCGLARLMRGYAVTAMENVALWHERDISHSSAERVVLPDSCMALDYSLDIFAGVIRSLKVFPHRMRENMEATRGLVFSQRVMLSLIANGMSREESYEVVQRNASRAWDDDVDLRDLLRNDPVVALKLSPPDLETLFSYEYYVRHVDVAFERLGLNKQKK